MIQKISILLILLVAQTTFAQKAQKIGYIDRAYILENIPEYTKAQSKLDAKVKSWNSKLDKLKNEIEAMKLSLSNEKALLTSDLISDRNEDILIKQTELKKLQQDYFGTSGDLFMLNKQLVRPIQDQIFNAIQEISKSKKYDIIFDKASNDMVMLYNNPKYDISELVLRKIVKGRKIKENAKKKSDKEIAREKKKAAVKSKADERKTKQELLKEKIKKQNEAKAAKREALKKANAEKRAKKKAEIQARRDAAKNKGKKKVGVSEKKIIKDLTEEKKESPKEQSKEDRKKAVSENKKIEEESAKEKAPSVKTKEEIKAVKRQQLLDRVKAKKEKRDSLRKVAADKRAKKLAEIEVRKKKLIESKKKNRK